MKQPSIATFCERNLSDTLDLLRQMVAINSFTANAAGVNRLGELTAQAFAPLGFKPQFIPAARPDFGSHLVLKHAPIPNAPTIALVSHLDTVFTEEEEIRNNFHWRVEGTRIYGPGTNDIKGGTVMIHLLLAALRSEAPQLFETVNWVVLLNACEEVVSEDFGHLCRAQLPKDTLACLIFEGDGATNDDFSIVAARKGRATFRVEVSGRGAHAGSSHDRGANAVVQLADILSKLHRITDYDAALTVNIGSIEGGTVPNRVPHSASAHLEMRAFSPEVFARARDRILAIAGEGEIRSAADGHRCRISVSIDDENGPWPRNPATDHLVTLWQQTGLDLGHVVKFEERGGLSDGNVLWDAFPSLDGLGPRGENCHCSEHSADGSKEQEWVDVTSIVPKTVLNANAIARLVAATKL